jgi:hypothetical protein
MNEELDEDRKVTNEMKKDGGKEGRYEKKIVPVEFQRAFRLPRRLVM